MIIKSKAFWNLSSRIKFSYLLEQKTTSITLTIALGELDNSNLDQVNSIFLILFKKILVPMKTFFIV
jgi:hypothetical protein